MEEYIKRLLNPAEDNELKKMLQQRFDLKEPDWPDVLIETLNKNLPHNPRKVKAFLSAWKLYL
jgi:hypothetical protein